MCFSPNTIAFNDKKHKTLGVVQVGILKCCVEVLKFGYEDVRIVKLNRKVVPIKTEFRNVKRQLKLQCTEIVNRLTSTVQMLKYLECL